MAQNAEAVVVGSAIVNQVALHGKAPDLTERSAALRGRSCARRKTIMKAKPDINERYVIIMAGGRGERFWPVSCERMPKQLLTLLGGRSAASS